MSESQTTSPPAPTPAPPAPFAAFASPLPDAVKAASQRADDAIKALREQHRLAQQAQGTPQAGGGGTAQPPPPDFQPVPQPGQDAPPPAPQPQAPPPDAAALARAEQEARTWRGRFEAEQARARREIEDMQARLRELQAAPPPAAPPPTVPETAALSDKELEDYGPDLMEAVAKQARHAVRPLIDAAVNEAIRRVMGEVESVKQVATVASNSVRQTAQERFYADIERAVPNYQQIDLDPAFLAWLAEYDPIARRVRKVSLDEAVAMLDGPGAAAFFRGFLNQQAATGSRATQGQPGNPAAAAPGAPAPGATYGQEAPPLNLMDLASPGTATRATDPSTVGSGRIWTMAEIREHYRKSARGEYRDRAHADMIDREIALAQRQGRVRG